MEASLGFHTFLSFAVILAFSIPCQSAPEYGFTVELVHRDSPRSPYYNPADTPHQRMASAIRRSFSRANRLGRSSAVAPSTPFRVIVAGDGEWEYLLSVSLGSPPVTIVGIADTGSDLIWTPCEPCDDCSKQASPLFDPRKSSTYNDIPCSASPCSTLDQPFCGEQGLCEYSYSYGDGSNTTGNLATETLTLGSTSGQPVSFPKVIFGCGHKTGVTVNDRMDGIIGLGGGSISLLTQLGTATGGKFSYCLVPYSSSSSSKLNFGANAVVAGSGVISTPLIQKDPKTFYYLTLEAVSVGETRIEFTSDDPSDPVHEGNIVIDSGTPVTRLPQDFYTKIEDALRQSVKLPPASDPTQFLSLCYQAGADVGSSIPTITFHFKGADVELNAGNTFPRVDNNIICLALAPDQTTIYGNLAQMNYLIGFDTQNMQLSFKPVDCTSS